MSKLSNTGTNDDIKNQIVFIEAATPIVSIVRLFPINNNTNF